MILLIDNFDSFTYNLVDYFEQLGESCYIVRNDVSPTLLPDMDFTKIVLSPGPGTPEQAGYLMEYIKFFEHDLPILGICLGHQAIAQYFGAKVEKAIKPMHGKLSVVDKSVEDGIFKGFPNHWKVVRYHSLVVKNIEKTHLVPLAYTEENELMVFRHNQLTIYGIQYHPEAALTEFGIEILANWLEKVANENKAIPVLL
ncbi:aminodeoxychorismate/anthranilate synthase component II [Marivirga sp. S37H4]|uniref:Aminodeoxychorismate/anthranilate synthase component II n=1 Tax=Marivirga aurantiaca TaxID=2802615 RepID=A0A934X2B5_9BACT|nr:aminodeoxychorismate/anthranilate synthase component II [Marivirga aurantiaca]MBK6267035.1 aminodeoxychorismate/anthranilate synthase component II [Marivirga aurantiaca]